MDSGYDTGGSSSLEIRIAVLRDQLKQQSDALEDMVRRLEETRASSAIGAPQATLHAVAIEQYRATANNLLYLVPDDQQASSALEHAEALAKRTSGVRRTAKGYD